MQIYNEKYPKALIIIGGDFNARIVSENCVKDEILNIYSQIKNKRQSLDETLNQRGKSLINFVESNNLLILNGRVESDVPAKFTYRSTLGASVIDLVMCNFEALPFVGDLKVEEVVTRSDHLPIILSLNLEFPGTCNRSRTIKWKEERAAEYNLAMLESPNVAGLEGSLNAVNDNLINTIVDVAKKIKFINIERPLTKFREPWFNTECQKLKKIYRAQLRKLGKKRFDPQRSQEFHEFRNYYFRYLEWTKAVYEAKGIQALCEAKDSKTFWSIINKHRRFKPQVDTYIKLDDWSAFFAGSLPHDFENFYPIPQGNGEDAIDSDISLYELCIGVKKLKTCKAAGPDGVTNEFLINLPGNWLLFIVNFFNRILQSEVVPDSWSDIILRMLHKKGSLIDPNNYRPIALLNTITKLFTLIMNRRVYKWAEVNKKLPESQAGFRSKRSTVDHIFTLNTLIQSRLRIKGGKLYTLFVDLKSAFSSVKHNLLWKKLYSQGLSSKIINIFGNLYSKANLRVRTSEGLSERCAVLCGVLQGEVMSPLFFALFIADIEKFLISKGVRGVSLNHHIEIIMLAFADDMVFMADTPVWLRRIIKHLEEYFQLNGLEVNIKKTNIVVFQKGGFAHKAKLSKFLFNGKPIEFAKTYTYLGVTFNQSGLFEVASKEFAAKAKRAIPDTVATLGRIKSIDWKVCTKLFESLVSSIALYSAPIWSPLYLESLEVVQNNFLRHLLHLPANTPGYALRHESGWVNMEVRVFKLIINFLDPETAPG